MPSGAVCRIMQEVDALPLDDHAAMPRPRSYSRESRSRSVASQSAELAVAVYSPSQSTVASVRPTAELVVSPMAEGSGAWERRTTDATNGGEEFELQASLRAMQARPGEPAEGEACCTECALPCPVTLFI